MCLRVRQLSKVQIFWRGHKIFQISTIDLTVCNVDFKPKVVIWQNYVAFSQNPYFIHVNQQMESIKKGTHKKPA